MPILFSENSKMFIDHTKGSLGIGTSTSTANLYVIGNSILNGNLNITGTTNITTVGTLTNLTVSGNVALNNLLNITTNSVSIGTSNSYLFDINSGGFARFNNGVNTQEFITWTEPSGISLFRFQNQNYMRMITDPSSINTIEFGTSDLRDAMIVSQHDTAGVGRYMSFNVNNCGERMRINYLGNVGIGTTNPNCILDVAGDFNMRNGVIKIDENLVLSNISLGNSINNSNLTSIGRLTSLNVNTGLSVLSNGNVGIGTTIPMANLHTVGPVNFISTTGPTGMYIRTGNVGIGTSVPMGNLHVLGHTRLLGSLNTTGLYIHNNGNVGIGTSIPNANLHVFGTAQITGTIGNSGLFIDNIGEVGINTSVPTSNLHVLGTTQILGATGTTGMYVNTVGNIGIGTTNAQGNLHVLGHTRLLGSLNTTGLYVHNNGNVGIGTSVPNSNLHVLGTTSLLNLAGTNGMYINTLGNVGIGTTNALFNLDVNGTSRFSNTTLFQGQSSTINTFGTSLGMDNNHCTIQLNANLVGDSYIDFSTVGSDFLGRLAYYTSSNAMVFVTRLTERMRIDSMGNVGINTNSATNNLHVVGGITSTTFNNFSISSPVVSGSTTTNNILTFPSGGVYFLLVSHSGTSSSTPQLTDNLVQVYLAIVSVTMGQVYLEPLYRPSTGWFTITSTSAYTVNLVINSPLHSYNFYYQKLF